MPDPINIDAELADLDIGAELATLPAESAPQPQPSHEPYLVSQQEWDAMPVGEKMNRFGKWAINMIGGTFMGQRPQETQAMGEHPGWTLAGAAVPVALQKGPGMVARGLGISKARASQNLDDALVAAKDVPLDTEKLWLEGVKYRDLVAAGGRPASAANKLMKRIENIDVPEMTFEEGRRFYSNLSRLSANEYNNLNPQMQRQVAAMRQALNESLTRGAESVGKGQQYAKGIGEYARAAKATEAGKKVAKYGVGLTGAGLAGNYALDKILEALTRTSGSR